MTDSNTLTVKALATRSGVSIRTLHYYDEIDLLRPERTSSGYRIYNQSHILRLQQILIQKSLGLSLSAIKSALDDPHFDTLKQLQSQKKVLLSQIEKKHKMIAAIDAAITNASSPHKGTEPSLEVIFGGFDPEVYAEEVRQNWDDTPAYQMSCQRTKNYSPEDWKNIKHAEQSIWEDAAKAMTSNAAPSSNVAGNLVAQHRRHIDQWFYETTNLGYASLADIWESDPRFTETMDQYGAGLTRWFAAATRHKYGAVI